MGIGLVVGHDDHPPDGAGGNTAGAANHEGRPFEQNTAAGTESSVLYTENDVFTSTTSGTKLSTGGSHTSPLRVSRYTDCKYFGGAMKTNRSWMAMLLLLAPILLGAAAQRASAQSWIQLAPPGTLPAARDNQLVLYDTTSDTLIMFGGSDCSADCQLNDVWILSHADGLGGTPEWTQLTPTGGPPPARVEIGQQGIYDPTTNRMVIFGGNPMGGYCGPQLSDVWVLTHANGQGGQSQWIQLNPLGGPVQVRGASGVYDPATNRMIVFGGSSDSCGSPTNNVWVLSHANGLGGTPEWTQLTTAGGPIPAREFQGAVYDPHSNIMTVFGGNTQSQQFNDTWMLSNANGLGGTPTWTQLTPTGVPPDEPLGFATAYDPLTNSMIIFGGGTNVGYENDVWMLLNASGLNGTPSWVQLSPTGTPPSARDTASIVFSTSSDRMIMFGGRTDPYPTFLNDTWVLASVTPPPTVSGFSDLTLTAGESGSESFSITGTGMLGVTVTSSNTSVLPDGDITGASACTAAGSCTLAVNPPAGESGTATVNVSVVDIYDQAATGTFDVTVTSNGGGGNGSGGGGSGGGGGASALLTLASLAALAVLGTALRRRLHPLHPTSVNDANSTTKMTVS